MDCYYKTHSDGRCETVKDPKPECLPKIEACQFDVEYYHHTCDKYWGLSAAEIKDMTESEVELALMQIDLCIMLRNKHAQSCVDPQCVDDGHTGAIYKLKDKLKKVKAQKYRLRLEKIRIDMAEADTMDDIYQMVNEYSRVKDVDNVKFPRLGQTIVYKSFVQEVAKSLGVEILESKIGGLDIVGLLLPSGRLIVETSGFGGPSKAYKNMATYLVKEFASKSYQKNYFKFK